MEREKTVKGHSTKPVHYGRAYPVKNYLILPIFEVDIDVEWHTFVSLTYRKVVREKIVVGHSKRPVHQERSTYPPGGHCGDLGTYKLRSIGGKG